MQRPPIPEDESKRLATLRRYEILDTPEESDFDDFVRLASMICGAPIGLISLVDKERQWFKSKVGVEMNETPRDVSFCAHGIHHAGVFEVEDALRDERFHDNPLVTGAPHIRFYAGAPLVSPEGQAMGMLCVNDRVPRRLTEDQREALSALARQVVHLLELRLSWRRERKRSLGLQEEVDSQKTVVAKHAQDLSETRSWAQAVLDSIPEQVAVLDERGHILFNNVAWQSAVGKQDGSPVLGDVGTDYQGDCSRAGFAEVADMIRSVIQGRLPETSREILFHSNSRDLWYFCRVIPLAMAGQARVAVAFEDVTVRKTAEIEILETETWFRNLFEYSPDGILIADQDGIITRANRSAEILFGYERHELIDWPVEILLPSASDSHHHVALRNKYMAKPTPRTMGVGKQQLRGRRKDGTEVPLDIGLSPLETDTGLAVIISARDVTERENAQRLLLRSQRVQSLGTLASGVAHDLNNVLAPILMGCEYLLKQSRGDTSILETMESSAKRGAQIVSQLLALGKGNGTESRPIALIDLFDELEGIIQASFPKDMRLDVRVQNDLSPVTGDSTGIHQVLLNLCVNARDAMPHGGVLTLDARNIVVDSVLADAVPEASLGPHVVVRVHDTGVGIPKGRLDQVFEPFFSTKDPDSEKGRGLGLFAVHRIVHNHGGFYRVYSTEGQGTTFEVFLPASPEAASVDSPDQPTKFKGQGETVLVVDDEENILKTTHHVLTSLNLNVVTASGGREALARVAECGDRLRVVITDLHMPEMTGLELVQELRNLVPQVPVIVSSGRMEEGDAKALAALGVSATLEKPHTLDKLTRSLMAALEDQNV